MSDYQADPPPRRPPPEGLRRPRPRRYEDDEDDYDDRPEAVETFIPYRNPMALTAYYLGVFALIPCAGLLLGPAALFCGIAGVRRANQNRRARGAGHAITGIVLGALATLGNYGVILFMAGAALLAKRP
jgi:hypothetical protein